MLNKITLIGRVGQEPKVTETASGGFARLSLACTERAYTLANGTKIPERTEWVNVTCGGGLAKVCSDYVHKGDLLYIEGSLRNNTWTDKQGVKRYSTDVMVSKLLMLGGKRTDAPTAQPQQQQPTFAEAMDYARAKVAARSPMANEDEMPF